MSAENIVRQYCETANQQDAEGWAALFAEDAVLHVPTSPEPTKGRAALKSLIAASCRAFPDMAWKPVGDPVEADDRVAFVVAVEGTHGGPLPVPGGEVPATGKSVFFEAAVFWKIDSDGLIAEERSYFDSTGMAAQLGLMG